MFDISSPANNIIFVLILALIVIAFLFGIWSERYVAERDSVHT